MDKKAIYCILVMMGGIFCSSCEKNNEPDNAGDDSATMLPIPASVVDGVRLTGMGNIGSVNYNPDGSISQAVLNGVRFDFEYVASRAAVSTGSKLQKIVVHNSREEYDEYEAYNFSFNTDGYIAKWEEYMEYDGGDEYGKATLTYTTDYNASGHIQKLNISGSSEYYDSEDGHETEPIRGAVEYKYLGGKLMSSSYYIPDEGLSEFFLGYDSAPENTYNIAPYPLSEVMGHSLLSEVADLFAFLGYLGKPSSHLPTSCSYEGDDMDMTISYKTNDHNLVTSMSFIIGGSRKTVDLKYNK